MGRYNTFHGTWHFRDRGGDMCGKNAKNGRELSYRGWVLRLASRVGATGDRHFKKQVFLHDLDRLQVAFLECF